MSGRDSERRKETELLNNRELSDAIVQTFALLKHCTPNGPEQNSLRGHLWALLSERERRLSNEQVEAPNRPDMPPECATALNRSIGYLREFTQITANAGSHRKEEG